MPQAIVFAYHNVGVRCLRVLLAHGVDVALVVTHADSPGETIWFDSVAATAGECGITTIAPENPNTPDLLARIEALAPDFLFSFYYRSMLSAPLLAAARQGAFNMHGSLLPKYRGRAPLNWAILKGERETGVTLHEMVEKPDAGRIVDQQAVPIGPDDTALEVFRRMTDAVEAVLKRSLPAMVKGHVRFKPNDLSRGSYYGRRRPDDGRIDWSKSAQEIHNLVRAVAPPFPGAFDDKLKVLRTRMEPQRQAPMGVKGPYREGAEWFALCGDGKVLRLLEVQERK